MRAARKLTPSALALAALVVLSTALRVALSNGVAAPWIAPDEHLYGLLGRSLVAGDGLTVLEDSIPYYSILYPLLVGLPFVWTDVADGVRGVQVLQAVLMSATAIPVYLWARTLAGHRWALVGAGLTVLVPGLAYSGLFMSEALYYPAATLATWALASCLVRPSLARQGLLLAAVGVALATRLQAVGFAAAIVVAIAVFALAGRTTDPFRRLLPTLSALGVAALVGVTVSLALGGAGELLGAYAPLSEARSYSAADVARSMAWHTGLLALLTAAVPLLALGVLAWETLNARETDPGVRALVATSVAYGVVTVVEVSAFASRFVDHLTERQLFSVAPPLFIALVVWLQRGSPRPQPLTSIVALAVASLTVLLPLDRVVTKATAVDAPSMIPLEQLSHHLSQNWLELLYSIAVAGVLVLVVILPHRIVPVVVVCVVAVPLATGSLFASREVRDLSRIERQSTFADASPNWIDAGGAREATLLVTGDRFWPSVWQEVFWNGSVSRVARLSGAVNPGLLPQVVVSPQRDGRLLTLAGDELRSAYVAASARVSFVGERIAGTPPSHDQPGVDLWRTEPPVRLRQRIVGLRPNGDLYTGEAARIHVFACGPGNLELSVLGKEGKPTRILVNGVVAAERAVRPGKVWRPRVPAPRGATGRDTCVFTFETDGLVGSTRIEWVPSGGAG